MNGDEILLKEAKDGYSRMLINRIELDRKYRTALHISGFLSMIIITMFLALGSITTLTLHLLLISLFFSSLSFILLLFYMTRAKYIPDFKEIPIENEDLPGKKKKIISQLIYDYRQARESVLKEHQTRISGMSTSITSLVVGLVFMVTSVVVFSFS